MQSGHGNGRTISNGYGRISHHGLSQQGVIKNHDPKAVANGNMANLNSMAKSEESRERERKEARAQRELTTRVNSTPSPDKNEAMFAVVPLSPNASGSNANYISKILGDFFNFANKKQTYSSVIGVDRQPPTPAPSSHIHDPDTYSLPPPPPAKTSSSSAQYSSHRAHHQNAPNLLPARTKNQAPSPSVPSNKQPSQFPFVEEMKRSHKSGPGPGPGSGNRGGPHQEREFTNKPIPHTLNSRGRPLMPPERINKDPQVMKIMTEMFDLKAPVSALLKTPRPDHQSTFTFPPPTSSDLMHSFRVPTDPCSKGKQNERAIIKPLDHRSVDECPLSEDSDDEAGNVSLQADSVNDKSCSSGLPLHSTSNRSTSNNILSMIEDNIPSELPTSPMKTTSESSNSDSSDSDSESSSSDEGGKKSPPPSSPPQNDTNNWNLTSLFQPGNTVKAESPKPKEISSRKSIEDLRESDHENSLPFSDHINEPAPPVITTVPNARMHKKRPEVRPKMASLNSLTTDESSEEENSRPTPKVQRTAGGRPSIRSNYNRNRHLSVSKNSRIVDPNLSSDSEDEPVTSSKRPPVISRPIINQSVPEKLLSPSLKSPKTEVALPLNKHIKKQDFKIKEPHNLKVKSRETISSDSDSDGEATNAARLKLMKNKSLQRVRHNGSAIETPLSNLKSPAVVEMDRSPLPFQEQSSIHRQRPYDLPKIAEKRRKVSEVSSRASSVTPRAQEIVANQPIRPTQKTEQCKRESREIYKIEKKHRKKNRRPNEESVDATKPEPFCIPKIEIPVESSRIKASVGASPIQQICASPKKEQLNVSSSVSKHIQYENGVPKLYISIPVECIDAIPDNKLFKSEVEEKVNKEVLERRTSGGEGGKRGKHIRKSTNAESPSNEEETKLLAIKRRAICSIYNKKRPNSLEPDKVKLKVKNETELLGTKSPPNLKVEDNHRHIKREPKMEVHEELKPPSIYSGPVDSKHYGSSTSLSSVQVDGSVNPRHSKKHKKEKRKDRSISRGERSREVSKELEKSKISSNRRKSISCSESEEVPKKRSKREPTTSYVNLHDNPSHPLKKFKKGSGQTPATSPSPIQSSPHPRSSQRNTSEERPHSSMSSDHYPHLKQSYHNSRSKATPLSSQLTPKGSIMASPYFDRESDYETTIGEATSHIHQEFNTRDKSVDETLIISSGNTSEYQSMPSSEHEPSVSSVVTYNNIDDRVSPQPSHSNSVASKSQDAFSHVSAPSQSIIPKAKSGAVAQIYYSTFEKETKPIEKDHGFYLNKAKELKHAADRETQHRWLQAVEYLEAVLYFILTGESMESEPSAYTSALKMYTDTLKLIKHVSSPVFRRDSVTAEGNTSKLNVILAVLSLRCQSLLSLKLYSMKRGDFKETMRNCNEYIRVTLNGGGRPMIGQASSTPSSGGCAPSTSTGSATPSAIPSTGTWGGSQRSAANNSPSSMSPTPSPAGSVGSEGSQSSSGYSTESARQQRSGGGGGGGPTLSLMVQMSPPTLQPNPDLHSVMKCFQVMQNLTLAHDMWVDADNTIHHNDEIKAFFIDIDQRMGPLTFNSSLRDLVPYVNEAISCLKKLSIPLPAPSL